MNAPKKKSFWGKGIWIAYSLFAAFILAIVGLASYQHFDLVETDYYEQGLMHQQKLDNERRAREEQREPTVTYTIDPVTVQLCFPNDLPVGGREGTVVIFRPSAASYDIMLPLSPDENGCQIIADNRLMTGFWRIKIDWKENGLPYYWEKQLFIEKGVN